MIANSAIQPSTRTLVTMLFIDTSGMYVQQSPLTNCRAIIARNESLANIAESRNFQERFKHFNLETLQIIPLSCQTRQSFISIHNVFWGIYIKILVINNYIAQTNKDRST